jgi:hypothetical protein
MSNGTPDMSAIAEQLKRKWSPILEHNDCEPIKDSYRRNVTAVLLENQEQAMIQEAAPNNAIGGSALGSDGAGAVKTWDPVLISLVRRAMPNLMAYDVCGVQPMTGPTGLIFALKAHYQNQSGAEALHNEALTHFAGSTGNSTTSEDSDPLNVADLQDAGGTLSALDITHGMSTATAEALGDATTNPFAEMAFTIERTSVVAKTRALKAEYTTELAQDLKAVHGLDAETELANILSNEVLAEINREVIKTIYKGAKLGAQQSNLYYMSGAGSTFGTAGSGYGGVYDLTKDSDGRWSAEKFRGLIFQIERECNKIALDTRRGKGNIVICSSDVASALAMGGFLQLSGGDAGNLNVDDTGNTFVGTIGGGRIKVYVDPYATINYVCCGYKGSNQYDAGMFYCPYVPLQMVRAVGEDTFQPKIGFKTRYGMVNNPFVGTSYSDPSSQTSNRRNQYYRIFRVDNLTPNAIMSS